MRWFQHLHQPSRTINPQRRPQNRSIKRPSEISRNRLPQECNIISKSRPAPRNATQSNPSHERERFERGDRTHRRHVLFRGEESAAPPVYQTLVNNTTVYLNVPDGSRMPLGNARKRHAHANFVFANTRA